MEKTLLYHNEDVVASFPYEFDLYQEEDGYLGAVKAHLYSDMKVEESDREKVNAELMAIPCIENSHFMLEGNEIVYVTTRKITDSISQRSMEITTRRSFIEDYIEGAEDLSIIAEIYHASFLKTEFVY
ncbi:MAG: hypothetical protein ACI32N_04135 [Bulleidia sp.]